MVSLLLGQSLAPAQAALQDLLPGQELEPGQSGCGPIQDLLNRYSDEEETQAFASIHLPQYKPVYERNLGTMAEGRLCLISRELPSSCEYESGGRERILCD
ncbi:hypothetical protein RHMOL_Rhmol12G0185300 [Rhododendron molle]|uniref:Uncharacterized protein n=1 Tax=Rhododendron molle TaxID=49168 RepID=A0ACC0LJH2_RHOML|nr:hypothetical protein RHMOL_Rhmol12G0185300 [Rhododendron molle]